MKLDAKTIIIIGMIGVIIAIIFQRRFSFASEMRQRKSGRTSTPVPAVQPPTAPRDPWRILADTGIAASSYNQGYGTLDSCTERCKNDVNCKAFMRTSASNPSDPDATCALFNMTNPTTAASQNASTYIKNV
jgi:hypothetical protein